MDKETIVYAYNAILFSLKKKEILAFATIKMNLENIIFENSNSDLKPLRAPRNSASISWEKSALCLEFPEFVDCCGDNPVRS